MLFKVLAFLMCMLIFINAYAQSSDTIDKATLFFTLDLMHDSPNVAHIGKLHNIGGSREFGISPVSAAIDKYYSCHSCCNNLNGVVGLLLMESEFGIDSLGKTFDLKIVRIGLIYEKPKYGYKRGMKRDILDTVWVSNEPFAYPDKESLWLDNSIIWSAKQRVIELDIADACPKSGDERMRHTLQRTLLYLRENGRQRNNGSIWGVSMNNSLREMPLEEIELVASKPVKKLSLGFWLAYNVDKASFSVGFDYMTFIYEDFVFTISQL